MIEDKRKYLKKLKPKKYRIYGIFDFKSRKLIYINMNKEDIIFEFDLEGYDSDEFDIVSFEITIG